VFYLPMNTGAGLVYDPLAANQSAGVLTLAAKVLAWAKGAGPNDAREVKKGEFDVTYEITLKLYPKPRTWTTKAGLLTGYRLSPAPLTKAGSFAAGSPALADAEATSVPTPTGWPVGPYQRVINGAMAGYYVANGAINLGPEPLPDKTYTQDEVDKMVQPLQAKIISLQNLIDAHVEAQTKPEIDFGKATGIISKP